MMGALQAERARRIEEKKERRRYERQMQRRQEYVARCRDELEERRRKVNSDFYLLPVFGVDTTELHTARGLTPLSIDLSLMSQIEFPILLAQ